MASSSSFIIKNIKAREVLNGRGEPSVEVEIITEGGIVSTASVPTGRSRSKYEAVDLRDGGRRYRGMGVLRAIENINRIIAPALKGKDVRRQREIDMLLNELDGTPNKSKLGGNAILGVSLAVAKTAAKALGEPLYRYIGGANAHILPVPHVNVIEGGKLAATELDFQELHIIPVGAKSFSEALRMATEVYYVLGDILAKKYGRHSLNVGVEGGYTPPGLRDPREAFNVMLKAIEEAGYSEKEFGLGIDVAASHIYDEREKKYIFMGKKISREDLIEFYKEIVSSYPVLSIEDPLEQDDFEGFAELVKSLNIQIVGDDLFATNINRLKKGIEIGAANTILWKVNQIGTLTEALDVAQCAFRHGYGVEVSERSGQTEDTWLADLAVALNAGQIKTGAPCRGERTAQYNRLLRIEEELGRTARYPGRNFRIPF